MIQNALTMSTTEASGHSGHRHHLGHDLGFLIWFKDRASFCLFGLRC
jgi:hypothetical protein